MMDKKDLHQEAEDIRDETAADAPELAEHDRVAELQRLLEEANGKVLYAHAETQNVRRRLEAEKQQASAYAVTGFARDMLAVRDHLDRALSHVPEERPGRREGRRASSTGSKRRCANWTPFSRARASSGSNRSANRSTRTSTRR